MFGQGPGARLLVRPSGRAPPPHVSPVCQKPTTVVNIEGEDLRRVMLVTAARLGFNVLERLCFLLRDRIQGAYGAMEKI